MVFCSKTYSFIALNLIASSSGATKRNSAAQRRSPLTKPPPIYDPDKR
jgi:hypothetical protein